MNNKILSAKRAVAIASIVKYAKDGNTRAVFLGQTDRFHITGFHGHRAGQRFVFLGVFADVDQRSLLGSPRGIENESFIAHRFDGGEGRCRGRNKRRWAPQDYRMSPFFSRLPRMPSVDRIVSYFY